MTDKTETEAPRIFGRPLTAYGDPVQVFILSAPEFRCQIAPNARYWWHATGTLAGLAFDAGHDHPAPALAARAIESRIRSLVLSLFPLLDDAGKREVVGLCEPIVCNCRSATMGSRFCEVCKHDLGCPKHNHAPPCDWKRNNP